MYILRSIAAKLPTQWQRELRRMHFAHQIRRGRFNSEEPDYQLLPELVAEGDWVIDIGANVGHYTARLSELVGPKGRVISFEPVPETFAVLAWNMQNLGCQNVTLINAAISDKCSLVSMSMPRFNSGMQNFYQAHITTSDNESAISALAVILDDLALQNPISLIKIDVEGHESSALQGMTNLLKRDHPILILETESSAVEDHLANNGYTFERLSGSPNLVCRPLKVGDQQV